MVAMMAASIGILSVHELGCVRGRVCGRVYGHVCGCVCVCGVGVGRPEHSTLGDGLKGSQLRKCVHAHAYAHPHACARRRPCIRCCCPLSTTVASVAPPCTNISTRASGVTVDATANDPIKVIAPMIIAPTNTNTSDDWHGRRSRFGQYPLTAHTGADSV